jgi:malonyl-CoA O-methyltransferase
VASGLFVTGTDTGVGKTVVSAVLVRALEADYWKPVQAGLDGEADAEAVARLAAVSPARIHRPAVSLRAALAPDQAAALEGRRIDLECFELPAAPRPLVVEGAGGVLAPLNERASVADLMLRLGLPVVLVARTTLGTINHTLLSLEALRARGLGVAGVVLDGPPHPANRRAIEARGEVRVLLELEPLAPLDAGAIARVAARATSLREVLGDG